MIYTTPIVLLFFAKETLKTCSKAACFLVLKYTTNTEKNSDLLFDEAPKIG